MKVQEIITEKGFRYILLDDQYQIVKEVDMYLRYLDARGCSPNTLKNYAHHIMLFYRYMNSYHLDVLGVGCRHDMNPTIVFVGFLEHLNGKPLPGEMKPKKIRKNSTINIIMDTVLEFYDYLAKIKIIEELDVYKESRANPKFKSFLYEMRQSKFNKRKSIFRKKEVVKPLEYITRSQYEELFECCKNRRDKLLLALMFEGGLRLSETLGIHLEDIDSLEDGEINIVARENNENRARVKNYAEGIIVIPDYVIDLLIEYITYDLLEFDSDFLFINLYGGEIGTPLKAITVEKLFERLSDKVGYHVHPHMLRHGFATEKKRFGWDIHDIASYLRHRNIQSTDVYITVENDMKKEIIRDFYERRRKEFGDFNYE